MSIQNNGLIETRLRTILAGLMRIDICSLGPNASTDTIDTWDSLNHMKLILALEEEFSLVFNEAQIEDMTSLSKISAVVTSYLKEPNDPDDGTIGHEA